MGVTVTIPSITDANVAPNPVDINSAIRVSILVKEVSITLEPYFFYSNDITSGEV